jgi:undecaprenyl diphosphate synthase
VRLLGRLDELPPATRASIESALDATADGGRLVLNIAFNYAGRTELVDAVRRIVESGRPAESIDETAIADALYTAGLPDPDLVIRTGGEQRLSNFLIWQAAYAELYTTEVLWPDFGADAFDAALLEFASRTRRFGR